MKKLLVLVATYLAVWGGIAYLFHTFTNAAAERGRHAIALGEEHGAQLKAPDALPPLEEACKAKLTPGDTGTLAAYVAKTTVKPADDHSWDGVVVGVAHVLRDDLVREGPARFGGTDLQHALLYNANPVDWSRHLTQARLGSPNLGAARYLLVAKYFSLTPPVNEGTDGYTHGRGAFSARVLAFPGGEVLCEGRGDTHMKETVSASGRAATKEEAQAQARENAAKLVPFVFSLSVTTGPLHTLCFVGGAPLCRLTEQWVGG
ncbi:MAG: hypothetical protein IPJ65_38610 [Archangiaceae bacterium]|nr:hypothetical protein [Archangiaceae bacterium]